MWAALLPDGELSQFERRILEVHLARCADCARHAAELAAIVTVVRETPSESMRSPVGIGGRPRLGWGRTGRFAVGGSAAAAAAAVLSFSSVFGIDRKSDTPPTYAPVIVVSASSSDGTDEARLWRQTKQAERAQIARSLSGRGPGPVLPMG